MHASQGFLSIYALLWEAMPWPEPKKATKPLLLLQLAERPF
jgi:hypothetical protein